LLSSIREYYTRSFDIFCDIDTLPAGVEAAFRFVQGDRKVSERLRELVANVASAYFSNAHVPVGEIKGVVAQIADSLSAVAEGGPDPAASEDGAPLRPTAAQIRKSVTGERLISFEDGRSYKALKRHLSTRGLTPSAYREKWGLPRDYPMVAPSYSAKRSALAKQIGLGRQA
jgi:predicted transcriptional regulator